MWLYDNTHVRRQDRLLPEERALEILRGAEYGILSMTASGNGNGGGYGVPLNFVFDGDGIWLHCAPEGEKLRHLVSNPVVSFCIVGRTAPQPEQFTTGYESVIVFGAATVVKDERERMEALELLIRKYSPAHEETGKKYAEKSLARTAIIRLEIERVSGKSKKVGF